MHYSSGARQEKTWQPPFVPPLSVRGAPEFMKPAIRKKQNSEAAKRSRARRKTQIHALFTLNRANMRAIRRLQARTAQLERALEDAGIPVPPEEHFEEDSGSGMSSKEEDYKQFVSSEDLETDAVRDANDSGKVNAFSGFPRCELLPVQENVHHGLLSKIATGEENKRKANPSDLLDADAPDAEQLFREILGVLSD